MTKDGLELLFQYKILFMNKTIESLIMSINNSEKIKTKLLTNMKTQSKKTIVLNLVELDFHFDKKEVELIYYAVDSKYPNTKLSFEEFKKKLIN